jgi:hypothetical protein
MSTSPLRKAKDRSMRSFKQYRLMQTSQVIEKLMQTLLTDYTSNKDFLTDFHANERAKRQTPPPKIKRPARVFTEVLAYFGVPKLNTLNRQHSNP